MKKFLIVLSSLIGFALLSCGKQDPSPSPGDGSFELVYSKNNDLVVATFDGSQFLNERNLTNTPLKPSWKPSWSKSGGKIVYFEYVSGELPLLQTKNIAYWKTKLRVINADGTGAKDLTDGTYGDFNATFLRDGSNRIIFIRMADPSINKWETWITRADSDPGEEEEIYDGAAMTSLMDGRIAFANTANKIYLLDPDIPGSWQTVAVESPTFPTAVVFTRMSISPDETKILFAADFSSYSGDYNAVTFSGANDNIVGLTGDLDTWDQKDCVLFVADFNKTTLKITNARIISPRGNNFTYSDGYNRWSPDGKKIFFHSKRSGKFQMYLYDLEKQEGPTLISEESESEYYFPCSENTPI